MLATLSLLVALGASAAPEVDDGLRLHWTAPESCPGSDELWRAYRGHLSQAPGLETLVDARVVIVRAADGSFSAELYTESDGRDGRRSLRAARCSDLLEALALVLAMAVSEQARRPEPAAVPTMAEPKRAPSPTRMKDPRLRLAAGAELGAGWGALPSSSPFARLRLEVGRARLGVALTGLWANPQWQRLNGDARRARWHHAELGLFGCDRFWGEALRGPSAVGCVGMLLSFLRGESSGVAEPGHGRATVLRAAAEVGLHWPSPWSRLSLGTSLLGGYALERPTFAVHGAGPVFTPPAWSLELGLGARVGFE